MSFAEREQIDVKHQWSMKEKNEYVRQVAEQKYEFGFTTDVHTEIIEKGLNEDIVRLEGLPLLEGTDRAEVGARPCAAYRLSGHQLLC